ncbi:MAG: GNAT family N-acetyltransferase [Pseudomonadota bacterium]
MTEILQPGTEVDVTITYLRMERRPSYDRPSLPLGPPTALIAAESPPVWYFLSLYSAVGGAHEWTDKLSEPEDSVRAFLRDPQITLYTLMRSGWPAGFFMLDSRTSGQCELAYFGLVPEVVGTGLGTYLLRTAVHTAWDRPGVEVLNVETCTLDHPRALALYQKAGFVPFDQSYTTRTLTRPRPDPTPPMPPEAKG